MITFRSVSDHPPAILSQMIREAIYENQAYVERVHFRETRDYCGVGMIARQHTDARY